MLWLSICNIEDKRAREREKERGRPAAERKASPASPKARSSPTGSEPSSSWLTYPDRINTASNDRPLTQKP